MRCFTRASPKWSASSVARAAARSMGGLSGTVQGSSVIHSIQVCSGPVSAPVPELRRSRCNSLRTWASVSGGMPALAMACSRRSISGSWSPFFAELLLDRLQLLAQDELALAVLQLLLGALADLLRQAQHLDAVRQQLQHLLQPLLGGQHLQQHLLLGQLDVHQAGGDVGQLRRRARRLQRVRQLGRNAAAAATGSPPRVRATACPVPRRRWRLLGLLEAQDARRQEGMARHQLEQPEALPAVADGMDLAVAGGHLARPRWPACRRHTDRRSPARRPAPPSAARCPAAPRPPPRAAAPPARLRARR